MRSVNTVVLPEYSEQLVLDSVRRAREQLQSKDNAKRLTALETSIDKRVTELENKFTPIGDGVYTVDPSGTWPPSRGEYKMKDEMSRNKIVELEKEIARILKDIEKIEKKVFNGN